MNPRALERLVLTALLCVVATAGLATGAAGQQVPGLGRALPAPLVEIRVLELALWQWIALLLLVAAAAGAAWLVAFLAARVARPVLARLAPGQEGRIVDASLGPARLGVAVGLVSVGLLALGVAPPVQAVLAVLERALVIIAVTWLLVRMTNLMASVVTDRLVAQGRASVITVVPLGRKAVKGVVLTLAFIAILQNLGVNVTGLLAGLGIGGLAVALAGQKTIENLFGGVTLITDQPVRVGDFCRFGDTLGVVEEIGLRSTRVRTLDRTVVSVPNAEFASMQLENFARRDRTWFRIQLGLRYETTPDQLRYVLVEVRRLLYSHAKVDPLPARIRFAGFGAHSLDLEVFAYVLTRDVDEFLAVREDILLRLMDIVEGAGTGFAFPSQTLYLSQDPGLDAAKRRAAEARVEAWRARGELCLPEFPPEQVEALRSTVDYPPAGSAQGRVSR
jgi:MscS family membrane protein